MCCVVRSPWKRRSLQPMEMETHQAPEIENPGHLMRSVWWEQNRGAEKCPRAWTAAIWGKGTGSQTEVNKKDIEVGSEGAHFGVASVSSSVTLSSKEYSNYDLCLNRNISGKKKNPNTIHMKTMWFMICPVFLKKFTNGRHH